MNRSTTVLFVKETIKTTALFLMILSLPLSAFAMEKGMGEKEGGSCKADVEKFCKEVKPGEGRIIRCLKENESQLSGECKQNLSQMKDTMKNKMTEKMKENREACKADVEEFCKDVQAGNGRILQCLKKHEEHISEKCRNSFHGKEQEHQPMQGDQHKMDPGGPQD